MKYLIFCLLLFSMQSLNFAQIKSKEFKKKEKKLNQYFNTEFYKELSSDIEKKSVDLRKYTSDLHGIKSEEYLIVLDHIALVYESQFNYPKVLDLRLEQLEIAKDIYDNDSYEILFIEIKLADILRD